MTQRLAGKVALVTGAARGIGFSVATAFVREGARVVVADLNGSGAAEAASRLGEVAMPVAVDVADPDSVAAMMAAILAAHGRVDILVNNAGIGANTPFLETSLAEWNRIIGAPPRRADGRGTRSAAARCARVRRAAAS